MSEPASVAAVAQGCHHDKVDSNFVVLCVFHASRPILGGAGEAAGGAFVCFKRVVDEAASRGRGLAPRHRPIILYYIIYIYTGKMTSAPREHRRWLRGAPPSPPSLKLKSYITNPIEFNSSFKQRLYYRS